MSKWQAATPLSPWPPELARYRRLIYTPLSLPEPPQIDMDQFIAWAWSQQAQDMNQSVVEHQEHPGVLQKSPEQKGREALGRYPWQIAWARRVAVRPGWEPSFEHLFPELITYIHRFPFRDLVQVGFLVQLGGEPGFLHVDPDDGLGMRFYLANDDQQRLRFYPAKDPDLWQRLENYTVDSDGQYRQRSSQDLVHLDQQIYAEQPQPRFAWALTSTMAQHDIDPIPSTGLKVTCLMFGRHGLAHSVYDTARLKILLDRSTQQYREYQIWHPSHSH